MQAYLGGSDGVLRVIRNPLNYPANFDGRKVPIQDYDLVNPNVVLRLPK